MLRAYVSSEDHLWLLLQGYLFNKVSSVQFLQQRGILRNDRN